MLAGSIARFAKVMTWWILMTITLNAVNVGLVLSGNITANPYIHAIKITDTIKESKH